MSLDTFVVEAERPSKPWYLARADGLEVLTQASLGDTRDYVARLLRGRRLVPEFLLERGPTKLRVILVNETKETRGLKPRSPVSAALYYGPNATETRENVVVADGELVTIAENLGGMAMSSQVWVSLVAKQMEQQQRPLPPWLTNGVFGACGALFRVIGVPNSATIKIARLVWPGAKSADDAFPSSAGEFPEFAVMFDPTRDPATMSQKARWQFEFQAGLFARWSLFGPAKNRRDRNAFWAFAELARRGQVTKEIFRQCYGMDWAQARRELRAYLRSKGVGLIEARMPGVMADVPEAGALQFNEASPKDAKRILGEFRRLREREAASKLGEATR